MRTFSQGICYYYDSKIKQCAMPSISAMARSLPAICLLTPISARFFIFIKRRNFSRESLTYHAFAARAREIDREKNCSNDS